MNTTCEAYSVRQRALAQFFTAANDWRKIIEEDNLKLQEELLVAEKAVEKLSLKLEAHNEFCLILGYLASDIPASQTFSEPIGQQLFEIFREYGLKGINKNPNSGISGYTVVFSEIGLI